jgi:uncharacterized membrane protein YGL010W
VIGNPRLHRWCDSQGLVNSTKVVGHGLNRHHVPVIFDFLGKGIRQPRKPAIAHEDAQVLTFNVAG